MAVPQTHRVHCIQASGAIRKTIITPPTQSATGEDSLLDDDIQPCQLPPNLTIGLWVMVKYADEEYPGEMTSIEDSDIEVSVMHKSVNAWKWPKPEDKIFYPTTQIVRVIDPPSIAGNQGQFVFENIRLIYSFASCLPVPCYVYNSVSLSVITCTSVTFLCTSVT